MNAVVQRRARSECDDPAVQIYVLLFEPGEIINEQENIAMPVVGDFAGLAGELSRTKLFQVAARDLPAAHPISENPFDLTDHAGDLLRVALARDPGYVRQPC